MQRRKTLAGSIADTSLFTKIVVAFVFFAILPINIF